MVGKKDAYDTAAIPRQFFRRAKVRIGIRGDRKTIPGREMKDPIIFALLSSIRSSTSCTLSVFDHQAGLLEILPAASSTDVTPPKSLSPLSAILIPRPANPHLPHRLLVDIQTSPPPTKKTLHLHLSLFYPQNRRHIRCFEVFVCRAI